MCLTSAGSFLERGENVVKMEKLFRMKRAKRRWAVIAASAFATATFAVLIPGVSSADNPSGCDFAATGSTESCLPALTGSTFAGGDGNLLTNPTTFGSTDWQNVAGLNADFDVPPSKP